MQLSGRMKEINGRVEHSVQFLLEGSDGEMVTLTIETTANVAMEGGVARKFDPENPSERRVLGDIISTEAGVLRVREDGTLTIQAGSTSVVVSPDPDFEAWSIDYEDGRKLVCLPGGDIARWGLREET